MNIFAIITLALITLVSADVSHLSRQYLPPSHTSTYSANTGYSTVGGSLNAYSRGSDYAVAAPIAYQAQTYSAPASSNAYSAGFLSPSYSTTSQHYAAPAAVNSYESYSAPISSNYNTYSAASPAVAESYISPAVTTSYLPPSAYTSSSPVYSAPVALLSQSYQSPVAETYTPQYQQTYAAPAEVSYSSPVATYSSSSGIDTQYGANGGYVY